jgi:hypothetical protein
MTDLKTDVAEDTRKPSTPQEDYAGYTLDSSRYSFWSRCRWRKWFSGHLCAYGRFQR